MPPYTLAEDVCLLKATLDTGVTRDRAFYGGSKEANDQLFDQFKANAVAKGIWRDRNHSSFKSRLGRLICHMYKHFGTTAQRRKAIRHGRPLCNNSTVEEEVERQMLLQDLYYRDSRGEQINQNILDPSNPCDSRTPLHPEYPIEFIKREGSPAQVGTRCATTEIATSYAEGRKDDDGSFVTEKGNYVSRKTLSKNQKRSFEHDIGSERESTPRETVETEESEEADRAPSSSEPWKRPRFETSRHDVDQEGSTAEYLLLLKESWKASRAVVQLKQENLECLQREFKRVQDGLAHHQHGLELQQEWLRKMIEDGRALERNE